MTRSVKNAEGSSLRCIDDNASFARALSSVNTDFQNFEAASPSSDHSPKRITVLTDALESRRRPSASSRDCGAFILGTQLPRLRWGACLSLLHPPDWFIHRDQF
jgi:hypothetical protein